MEKGQSQLVTKSVTCHKITCVCKSETCDLLFGKTQRRCLCEHAASCSPERLLTVNFRNSAVLVVLHTSGALDVMNHKNLLTQL